MVIWAVKHVYQLNGSWQHDRSNTVISSADEWPPKPLISMDDFRDVSLSVPRARWRNRNERQTSFTSDARDPSGRCAYGNRKKENALRLAFIWMTEDFQWPKKQPARNEVCFPTLVSRHVPISVQHSCRSRESPWIDGLSSSRTIIPPLSHNEQ